MKASVSEIKILLINPWIEDFSAFDLWIRPLGLLRLGRLLIENGFKVSLFDCLSSMSGKFKKAPRRLAGFGCSHYEQEEIEKPDLLKFVPLRYKRFGISIEEFRQNIIREKPDLIIIGTIMTYWYTGSEKVISCCKELFPDTPVLMGGVYPQLCAEYAVTNSLADKAKISFIT